MKIPASGACQCGGVTFTVTAEPVMHYACHCYSCQKRTGSAFSMGFLVMAESFEVTGEVTPWSRTSDKGNTNTRYSCAGCGNIIYGLGNTTPGMAKVQSGLLDDTSDVEPELHMWTCRKQPWVALPADAPAFDKEADAMEMLQAALDYRAARAG